MRGSIALMEMLKAEGVKYIFGNPGTSEAPILDAMEGYPEFEYMLAVQESVAIGMADSYARATGDSGLRQPPHRQRPVQLLRAADRLLLHRDSAGRYRRQQGRTQANRGTQRPGRNGAALRQVERGGSRTRSSTRPRFAAPSTRPPARPPGRCSCPCPPTRWTTKQIWRSSHPSDFPSHLNANPRDIEDAADLLAGAKNPIMLVGDRVMENGGTAARQSALPSSLAPPSTATSVLRSTSQRDTHSTWGPLSARHAPPPSIALNKRRCRPGRRDALCSASSSTKATLCLGNRPSSCISTSMRTRSESRSPPTSACSPRRALHLPNSRTRSKSEMTGSQIEAARGRAEAVAAQTRAAARGVPPVSGLRSRKPAVDRCLPKSAMLALADALPE